MHVSVRTISGPLAKQTTIHTSRFSRSCSLILSMTNNASTEQSKDMSVHESDIRTSENRLSGL